MVGNRHAVCVASQILEDPFGSPQGWLNVNDPSDCGSLIAQELEGGRVCQGMELALEAKLALAECRPEGLQENLPEVVAEHAHRQEEGGLAAGDPAGAVGRDAAAGYDAMQVRVQVQILSPGVKHCQEADGGAQQPRVCCRFQQSSGGGVEEEVVNRFGILQRQPADLLRQGEYYMEVGDWQKLRLPLCKPAGASRGLAFWAVAIPARVIEEDAMSAPVTLLEVAAEGRGPAVLNVSQRFPLRAR